MFGMNYIIAALVSSLVSKISPNKNTLLFKDTTGASKVTHKLSGQTGHGGRSNRLFGFQIEHAAPILTVLLPV